MGRQRLIRRGSGGSSNSLLVVVLLLAMGYFLGLLLDSSSMVVTAIEAPVTTTVTATNTTNVYLFIRDVTSSNLTYLDTKTIGSLGNFSSNNTICAQQSVGFFLPGIPLHSFQVIEYEDMTMQESTVLTYVPNNTAFLVLDSQTMNWFFWNGSSPLLPLTNIADYLNNASAWSAVCYIDSDMIPIPIPFFELPELSVITILSYVVLLLACIGALVAFLAMIVYTRFAIIQTRRMVKVSTLFWFLALFALFSTIYCLCSISGTGFFSVNTTLLAQFSVAAYWASMLAVLRIVVLFLGRDSLRLLATHGRRSQRKDIIFLLLYFLLLVAVLVLAFYALRNVLGPDDASPYTLHYYVNTLFGTPEAINENIRTV
jgi:hypothetical protein